MAQILEHLNPHNSSLFYRFDEGGDPNVLSWAEAPQRKHGQRRQKYVKQLEKSSNMRGQVTKGFKPLLLILRQIYCQDGLLNQIFLCRWVRTDAVDFPSVQETIRTVYQAYSNRDFRELFDQQLAIDALPAVPFEVVEGKCSETVHSTNFGFLIVYWVKI